MASKTDHLVVAPQPRTEEIALHHDESRVREELGTPYIYMASSLVPEADMHVNIRHVKNVPPDFKPYVEPHKHEVSQLYVFIGDITYEVTLEGEGHEISGPAAVFIPAGMAHTIHPLRGSGYTAVVTRVGKYGASAPSVRKETKITGKLDRFIASPEPAPEEVPYHNMRQAADMLGPQYTYMSSSLVPEADMAFTLRHVERVPPGFKSDDEPHKHDVSQLYAIIGKLNVAVILDGGRYEVNGPAAVFIPAGIAHTAHPLSGSGYLAVVTRAGKLDLLAP
ncbi:hypothetical protein ACFLWL_00305 [Chloroflexota bacterium]